MSMFKSVIHLIISSLCLKDLSNRCFFSIYTVHATSCNSIPQEQTDGIIIDSSLDNVYASIIATENC